MDHMTEGHVLARTGATVRVHQQRTVANTCGCAISRPSCRSSQCCKASPLRTTTGARISTNDTTSISPRCRWLGYAVCVVVSTPRKSSRSCGRWPLVGTACTLSARRFWGWGVMPMRSPAATRRRGAFVGDASPDARPAIALNPTACTSPWPGAPTSDFIARRRTWPQARLWTDFPAQQRIACAWPEERTYQPWLATSPPGAKPDGRSRAEVTRSISPFHGTETHHAFEGNPAGRVRRRIPQWAAAATPSANASRPWAPAFSVRRRNRTRVRSSCRGAYANMSCVTTTPPTSLRPAPCPRNWCAPGSTPVACPTAIEPGRSRSLRRADGRAGAPGC